MTDDNLNDMTFAQATAVTIPEPTALHMTASLAINVRRRDTTPTAA